MKKIFGVISMVAIIAIAMFINNTIAEAKRPAPPQDEWFSFGNPAWVTEYSTQVNAEGVTVMYIANEYWDCKGWSGSC